MTGELALGIETSNPSAREGEDAGWRPEVALARVGAGAPQLVDREGLDLSNPHDDDLMPAIARLCERAGVRPREIRRIAVSVGPGGFTAVRIAAAAAKMIAEVTGAACVPVPSAWVAACHAMRAGPLEGGLAVALAAKGPTAHVSLFEAGELPQPVGDGRLMTREDLCELPGRGVRTVLCDRFLSGIIGETGQIPGLLVWPSGFDAISCIAMSQLAQAVDPAELVPLYPREPEAVTKWRELKARRGG
ncbi:MAG: tRNA (adenosine(37)-N6)-threonylcarbamoyltransferase complex dimerization subunit type 1 TsaB [Phycisphaerales bacterium]|jgi:tRNA threonylcarbamoyl adenosine modification protein YeaZ